VCAAGGSPFEREGGVEGLLDRDEREGERESARESVRVCGREFECVGVGVGVL